MVGSDGCVVDGEFAHIEYLNTEEVLLIQNLLKLCEHHDIQSLIDGKAWVAPNEPTRNMIRNCITDIASMEEYQVQDIYIAMRNATTKE